MKYEGSDFYKGEVITFSATLIDIPPHRVSFFIDKLPYSVSHISSKKSAITINRKRSTSISISFLFGESGDFQLPPLRVNTTTGNLFLPFEKITIRTKKEDLKPIAFWQIEEKPVINKPFIVTLKAQNFKKLIKFDYEIPPNCIFEQQGKTTTEFFVDDETPTFTEVDVAKFKFTVYGEASLPDVFMKVLGANDIETDIVAETKSISPMPMQPADDTTSQTSIFNEAPLSLIEETPHSRDEGKIDSLLDKIHLQQKLFSIATKIFAILFLVFIILTFTFLIRRNSKFLIFMGISVFSAALFGLCFFQSQKVWGVMGDGTAFVIPDNTSGSLRDFMYGDKVEIQNKVNGWYLIEKNGISGWAEKTTIILVEEN
ncbi:MAG: hypothetical protein IIW10_01565 [Spirochaetaceae bacterium]|nr:hypothetical protein [Spirochaetaceae bacterium]